MTKFITSTAMIVLLLTAQSFTPAPKPSGFWEELQGLIVKGDSIKAKAPSVEASIVEIESLEINVNPRSVDAERIRQDAKTERQMIRSDYKKYEISIEQYDKLIRISKQFYKDNDIEAAKDYLVRADDVLAKASTDLVEAQAFIRQYRKKYHAG